MTYRIATGRIAWPITPRRFLHLLMGSCLLAAGASAHAIDWLKPLKMFGSGEELVIWQGPGQYVKIVDQDRFKKYDRAPDNDHPASLNAKDVAAVLASLSVGPEGGSTKGGSPLFAPVQVAQIAPQIADAFSKAQSRQDVIFAVAGTQGKSGPSTTAARAFVSEGQLNIILGDTQQPGGSGAAQAINQHEAPYRPGRRRESMGTAQDMGGGPGISFRPGLRHSRYDWAIIDVPTLVAAYRGPQIPIAAAPAGAAVDPAAGTTEETARLLQERQQMREEMARMRKQIEAQEGASPAAVAPASQGSASTAPSAGAIPEGTRSAAPAPMPAETRAATPPPAAAQSRAGAESVEQRLSVLQSLHSKKLITDEEYAAKRKKILEEL